MQSVHYFPLALLVVSFLHQIHVNYYFTSTFDDNEKKKENCSRKSNEKTRIVQSIASCLSAHAHSRDAVAFLTSLEREIWTHTQMKSIAAEAQQRTSIGEWTEIAEQVAETCFCLGGRDARDREVECGGLKWDEVTFEVKILIYGQFENSGLLLSVFNNIIWSLWTFDGNHHKKGDSEWWQWTRIKCKNVTLSFISPIK